MLNLINSRKACILFSMALFLTFGQGLLEGQDIVTSVSNSNSEEKEVVMSPVLSKMQQKVTVDFRETPIEDVLRMLSKQANVDIVKSPQVTGNVTATLTDIPLAEALDNILAAHGYGYIPSRNMIRVVPRSEIYNAPERVIDRVYRITYADVREVEKALLKFLSKQGSISANPGTSNIIVTDTESKVKAIDSFIKEIDRVTPQILVEVKIYDVTGTERLDLGVDWFAGTNTSFNSDGEPIGGNRDPFIIGRNSSSINKTAGQNNSIRFGWLNDNIDIDFLLRAEKQDLCATLLANPRVMVLDNEKAHFQSVTEIPYQELTETSLGGTIGTTSFREVGVQLDVIPHVTRDDMVRLRIMPEFSIVTGEVIVGGFVVDNPQPVVDSRKADTMLLVKDGQTIVLGGLKKKTINTQTDKVPLLGDLPIVGGLFKFNGQEEVTSELVVFLTPYIITKPTLTPQEARQLEITNFCSPNPCETIFETPCEQNPDMIK